MHNICSKPFRCGDNSCVTIILHLELYRHLQADCQNSQEIIRAIFCVEQNILYRYWTSHTPADRQKLPTPLTNNRCNILHITSYIEQNKANLIWTRLTLAASGTLLGQTAVNLSLLQFQLLWRWFASLQCARMVGRSQYGCDDGNVVGWFNVAKTSTSEVMIFVFEII